MSYVEILHSNGLTVKQWDDRLFSEYLGQVWWRFMYGTSSNAPIQIKDELTKNKGDAITIGLRGRLEGGHVTGQTKAKGNEGSVQFYNQEIRVDNVRDIIKFEDVPLSQRRVNFSLLNQGREALEEEAKLRMEDDVTNALCDTASGRVRGRYLYGSADANWNATHATALTNIDAVNDVLTTSMIDAAKRKALIPRNALARVRPMKVNNGKAYEEWYTLVAHTYPIRDLVTFDAAWKNRELNLTPRGDNSVLYTGSSFKGAWNGTLVYEYERLPLVSSTIQVAHNLLLGAQAAAIVWAQRSKFGEEEEDIGHDVVYELHEIRGIQKLVFNRPTPEDNGVIHLFSAAVADA